MSKNMKKSLTVFSLVLYIVTAGFMIYGTFNDLQVDIALFNPQNKLSIAFECFGEAVAWGIWGPVFTVLILTRHNLNESLEIIGRVFPFVKSVKNTDTKAYKFFDFVLKIVTTAGFFVLSVVGYKKIIENVAKKFVSLSQPVYFIICTLVAAAFLLAFRKIDKKVLNKLETISLAFLFMSIGIRLCMYLKPITHRVRFREMVAASNGIFNSKGMSYGTLDRLVPRTDRAMLDGVDFSAYTPWYKIGDDMGIYSHPDSFPSGHTFSACCAFLSILLCSAYKRLEKITPLAMLLSAAYVYTMGYTRMVEGAHYLTDVASAALIGYTVFLITVAVYNLFVKKKIFPTRNY